VSICDQAGVVHKIHSFIHSFIHAQFRHIEQLFHVEEGMSLKKAHTLKLAAFNPRSIEKNVSQVGSFSFLCIDSWCAVGLYHYAIYAKANRVEWNRKFHISFIIKLWNVMNVNYGTKGKHKRNYTMDPVRTSLDDSKLTFLRETTEFWFYGKAPN